MPYDGNPRENVIDPDPAEPLACAVRVHPIVKDVVKVHEIIRAIEPRTTD